MGVEPTAEQAPSAQSAGLIDQKISIQEVERKWVVTQLPDLTGLQGKEVMQGYIGVTTDGIEIRLRQNDNTYFQTIKGTGDLVRSELEVELSKAQFDSLWLSTEGRRLEKVRYEILYGDLKIELDVYRGSLSGLMVAEVEFSSLRDAGGFTPPDWFGAEVTSNQEYKNKNLALTGRPPAVH